MLVERAWIHQTALRMTAIRGRHGHDSSHQLLRLERIELLVLSEMEQELPSLTLERSLVGRPSKFLPPNERCDEVVGALPLRIHNSVEALEE